MKINYNQIVTAFFLMAVLVILPACWPFNKKDSSVAKASLYVINVLDKKNYDDCRIAGSINVPFDGVEAFAKDLHKSAEIVVYCANYMCSASMAAAEKLKEMGFEYVWAYEGGTAEWYYMNKKSEGAYPVEGACRASYLFASNEKPEETSHKVSIISADELRQKMIQHGLLKA